MIAPTLTVRQTDLLRRVAEGATYRQVAAAWGVSEVTVRGHGHRLLAALGARSIAHAVHLGHEVGLIGTGRARRHGDHAGYAAHVYRRETPCEACRAGEAAYRAALKAKKTPATEETIR